MAKKDQEIGEESIERRGFIKQAGATILGGIAYAALLGSPALADTPGMKRLMKAVSEKTLVTPHDWDCSVISYTERCDNQAQFGCQDAVWCSPDGYFCQENINCSLGFDCYGGNDDAYGCSGRQFQCGSMDGHEVNCGGDGGQFN